MRYISREEFYEFMNDLLRKLDRINRDPEFVFFDERGLCDELNISKRHARDLRLEGKIRYSKDGGKLYYRLSWISEYIAKFEIEIPKSDLLKFKKKYGL